MNHKSFIATAVSSSRVVTPAGLEDAAVLIRSGRIEAVVPPEDIPHDFERRDYGDLVVMAGLVDPHVHINEPGRTEWEGFRTATMAGAAGGVTTLIDMPLNSTPVTTSVEALDLKVRAAEGRIFVDCGFYGGLVPGGVHELEGLIDRGVFGIKAFLIDSGIEDYPAVDEETVGRAMTVIAKSSIPLLVHAELATGGSSSRGATQTGLPKIVTDYADYLSSRPASWETAAISMLSDLALRSGCRVHIVHLAAADALEIIRDARDRGAALTVETCPHYLFFDAESIGRGKTLFKCAPPIRDRSNNDRLIDALLHGEIDFIASDHSPTIPSAKALDTGDFTRAWGGIASLQLRLPVTWTLARPRGASLDDLARWLASRPAEFLGLNRQKGSIAPGCDADLVVWDPEAEFIVTPAMLHDRHKLTPYEGERLFGAVKSTYLRGTPVFDEGHLGEPAGRVLYRP
ncbi:MAG TPA: allantoinase AllB [Rhodothermales bacterium]